MKCFECEATKDLQEHHVVPRSRGGTKTITLCHSCHMKAHGRDGKGMNHSRLVSEGIKKKFERDPEAKSNWGGGRYPARAVKAMNDSRVKKADAFALKNGALVSKMRNNGLTLKQIAAKLVDNGIATPRGTLKWNPVTVRNLLIRYESITKENK